MDIQVLASGSKGNCYMVSDGHTKLLIECGLPVRKIQEGLRFGLSEIEGVLVSHEHMDHARAAGDLMERGLDVYMSQGTAEALGLKGHRLQLIKHGRQFEIGSFFVLPFETQHDATESLGFVLVSNATSQKLLYASDTYYLRYRFRGLNYIMVECNYMLDTLEANVEAGIVPRPLRDRLVESHFGLHNLKEFFRANDLSRVKGIWLIHMSETNCDPARAKREIQEMTGLPVYIAQEVALCR